MPLIPDNLFFNMPLPNSAKRIGVTFRGSVTVRDWMVDANQLQTVVEDPTVPKVARSQRFLSRQTVALHSGFYHYLFAKVGKSDGTMDTKYQIILNHLRSLLKEREGYHLEVTGHSLGGALATMFSFFAACEDWMPLIICLSFAAPRVGNIKFRRAFHRMEETGRIQHLRVVNQMDPVPLLPDRLNWLTAIFPAHCFRHVGIQLRLYPKKKSTETFYRSRLHKSYLRQVGADYLSLV